MNHQRLAGRINLLGPWLRERHGRPVVKIPLDAGLGCPHRAGGRGGCAFCPPSGSGTGAEAPVGEQVRAGLAALQARAARRGREAPGALAYLQAHSGTHAPLARLREIYAAALDPGVLGLIVSTRPDCLDEARWQLLAELWRQGRLAWLELGLQSSDDATLARINRGHDAACFARAAARAGELGIPVVAHVILGLPGETPADTWRTAAFVADNGLWGVKLHHLMVLEGAALADEWRGGGLTLWDRATWARAAAGFLARLPEGILVHRLAADPGRDRLLAPGWAGDKDANLTALAAALEESKWRQGSLSG